jgi:hypothetical protein
VVLLIQNKKKVKLFHFQMCEYKEQTNSPKELRLRQMSFDLYSQFIEEEEEPEGFCANQVLIARGIECNSRSKLPLPFLYSIKSLNEYFKTQKPKTFDSGFKHKTMDILINDGITAEHRQVQIQSLFAVFYLVEFIEDFLKYFMDNEYYLALDQFLTGEPCRQMYASLLITYVIVRKDKDYVNRLVEILPFERMRHVIVKEVQTDDGFTRLITKRCRPLITRILALIFVEVVKEEAAKETLRCANLVFSSGFSYSLNEKYNIPSICARGIYYLYKSKQFDDSYYGDEPPEFILFASVCESGVTDTVNLLKATFPFIEKSPVEFTCEYDNLMEIAHDHMQDRIGVYALRCIKMIIDSDDDDSCMSAFIDNKGLDFLHFFATEETSFVVLTEAMRIVIIVIQRITDPEDLELLLTPEIFQICVRCTEIQNDEMLNAAVKAIDLISLRCTDESKISCFLELAENVDLYEVISNVIDDLDEETTERARSLLEKICPDDD